MSCLLMISSSGAAGDKFIEAASAHYRAFWKLRTWAVAEQIQIFQLTEKAFIMCLRFLDSWILRFLDPRILRFLDSEILNGS